MEITLRDLITMVHGMMFGVFFLMAVFGVVVTLCHSTVELSEPGSTAGGRMWWRVYLAVMVILGWGAVLSGAYLVYPWYRAVAPAGVVDLTGYPQRLLISNPHTAGWHTLGMEWKEHVSWMAPIIMTMVAYVLIKYEGAVEEHRRLRTKVAVFAMVALLSAGVGAGFGALIDKVAPVQGGQTVNLIHVPDRGTK